MAGGSSSAVISVRVPRRLKEELERLGVNYAEEVRRFLEELVRRERARRLRERMEALKARVGRVKVDSEALVREDRDVH